MSFNSTSIRATWDTLRSLPSASIVVGYTSIGTALTKVGRIVHILNTTDAALMFSWDGRSDHFVLPAGGYMVIDLTTNQSGSDGFFLPVGSRLYVKQIGAPSTGSVYFSLVFSI